MSEYPLVEKLGLLVHTHKIDSSPSLFRSGGGGSPTYVDSVNPADLERVLERAPVQSFVFSVDSSPQYQACLGTFSGRTHTARLLLIEPLVKDTAEAVIKDFIAMYRGPIHMIDGNECAALLERARKLLKG